MFTYLFALFCLRMNKYVYYKYVIIYLNLALFTYLFQIFTSIRIILAYIEC